MQSAETKAFHLNVFLNKCLRKHQGGEQAPVERSVGVVGGLGRELILWKTRASPQLRLFAEVKQAGQPVAFSFPLPVFQQLEGRRLSEFIVHT